MMKPPQPISVMQSGYVSPGMMSGVTSGVNVRTPNFHAASMKNAAATMLPMKPTKVTMFGVICNLIIILMIGLMIT